MDKVIKALQGKKFHLLMLAYAIVGLISGADSPTGLDLSNITAGDLQGALLALAASAIKAALDRFAKSRE